MDGGSSLSGSSGEGEIWLGNLQVVVAFSIDSAYICPKPNAIPCIRLAEEEGSAAHWTRTMEKRGFPRAPTDSSSRLSDDCFGCFRANEDWLVFSGAQ